MEPGIHCASRAVAAGLMQHLARLAVPPDFSMPSVAAGIGSLPLKPGSSFGSDFRRGSRNISYNSYRCSSKSSMLTSSSAISNRQPADLWISAAALPPGVLSQSGFRGPTVVGIPRGTDVPAPTMKMTRG